MLDSQLQGFDIYKKINHGLNSETEQRKYLMLFIAFRLGTRMGIFREQLGKDTFLDLLASIDMETYENFRQLSPEFLANLPLLRDIDSMTIRPDELGDFLGEIYIKFEGQGDKKSKGKFYTPPHIIQYLIDKVIEESSVIKNPYLKILDPACGSGFFLYHAFKKLKAIYLKNLSEINKQFPHLNLNQDNINQHIVKNNLYGIDIDPLGALITKIGVLALGYGCPNELKYLDINVICRDSLFYTHEQSFDIIIGNPPWVSFGLRGLKNMEEGYRKKIKNELPNASQYKLSYYALFVEKGVKLLKNQGRLAFILPDSYLLGHYYTNLRSFLMNQGLIREITIIGTSVFQGVTIGYETLFIYEKDHMAESKVNEQEFVAQWVKDAKDLTTNKKKSFRYSQAFFTQADKLRFYLCFDPWSYNIIQSFQKLNAKLRDVLGFYSGCIAKYGQQSIISDQPKERMVIKDKTGKIVWQDNHALECWKPLLESGGSINPFAISPNGKFIYIHPEEQVRRIYGKSGFKLKPYREGKILLRQTGDKLIAALDKAGFYTLNNIHLVYSLNGKDDILYYVLGLLNSKLYNYYYQIISLEKGRALAQIDLDVIKEMPLLLGKPYQRDMVVELVKEIMIYYQLKDRTPGAQRKIDINKKINNLNELIYDMAKINPQLREHIEQGVLYNRD